MWKKMLMKRTALTVAALALSLTWIQSGRTQGSACVPERGIDPLDVLNEGVRHNVWILLDTSGSMGWDWNGNSPVIAPNVSRLQTAKDTLTDLITTTLVEPNTGDPYVNWGFVAFDTNMAYTFQQPLMCNLTDVYQSDDTLNPSGMCVGLDWDNYKDPPECGGGRQPSGNCHYDRRFDAFGLHTQRYLHSPAGK